MSDVKHTIVGTYENIIRRLDKEIRKIDAVIAAKPLSQIVENRKELFESISGLSDAEALPVIREYQRKENLLMKLAEKQQSSVILIDIRSEMTHTLSHFRQEYELYKIRNNKIGELK